MLARGDELQAGTDVFAHVAALAHDTSCEAFGADEVFDDERFLAVGDDLDLSVAEDELDDVLSDVDIPDLAQGKHDVDGAAHAGAIEELILRDDDLLHIEGEGVQHGEQDDEAACADHRPFEVFGGKEACAAAEVGVQRALDVVGEDPECRDGASEDGGDEELSQKRPRRKACARDDAFCAGISAFEFSHISPV